MERVEQYVMAYRGDHNKIKDLLPENYVSLRPVLRLNVEITDVNKVKIQFNTPVESVGKRGWLNLTEWTGEGTDIAVTKKEKSTIFTAKLGDTDFLNIKFTCVGIEGGCPKENDNDGTFFTDAEKNTTEFIKAETIDEKKEYCDCTFEWSIPDGLIADGKDTLIKKAMAIGTEEVLGAYVVEFQRS